MKYFSAIKSFLFVLMVMGFNYAEAASITAKAEAGSSTPTADTSESVANGDFFITGASRGRAIGDGKDESTLWAMNFRTDRTAFKDFNYANPTTLVSATLKLKLTPMVPAGGIGGDTVRIEGLPPAIFIGSHPVGVETTVIIDLLVPYTDQEILDALIRDRPQGVFFMIYQDDAVVSFAELILEY